MEPKQNSGKRDARETESTGKLVISLAAPRTASGSAAATAPAVYALPGADPVLAKSGIYAPITLPVIERQWRFELTAGLAGVLEHGECLPLLKLLPANSVDLILTDPPYFLDGMDGAWNRKTLGASAQRAQVIGSMPVGMKFDPKQGVELQKFLEPIFLECLRVLKPGGIFLSFSQARLYHRCAIAAENAGFEIRDMFGWTYEGQPKAFSQDHFVRKMNIPEREKAALIQTLQGSKTPQLKPMIEPIVFGQKPKDGTFVQNWIKHGVGLADTSQTWDGKFPGALMNSPKPGNAEKGDGNDHLTVKPQKVLRHLIRIFTQPGALVLDPFLGSGSSAVAAVCEGRGFIGFERDAEHCQISKRRIEAQIALETQNQKSIKSR